MAQGGTEKKDNPYLKGKYRKLAEERYSNDAKAERKSGPNDNSYERKQGLNREKTIEQYQKEAKYAYDLDHSYQKKYRGKRTKTSGPSPKVKTGAAGRKKRVGYKR
jgi:hypothetical protein